MDKEQKEAASIREAGRTAQSTTKDEGGSKQGGGAKRGIVFRGDICFGVLLREGESVRASAAGPRKGVWWLQYSKMVTVGCGNAMARNIYHTSP